MVGRCCQEMTYMLSFNCTYQHDNDQNVQEWLARLVKITKTPQHMAQSFHY